MNTTEKKKPKLTKRELVVLKHIAEGQTSQQVADTLQRSKRTIDFHLDNIYDKLESGNRMQAVNSAKRLKII